MTAQRGAANLPEIAVARLYKEDLVTRHTGRAVRLSIEGLVSEAEGQSLTVLDFRDVNVIDFSCADEIVAKLMLRTMAPATLGREHFFLFRGIGDHHLDPVESALRRRGLVVPAETPGGEPFLIGDVEPQALRVWEVLCRDGRGCAEALAPRLGMDEGDCGRLLRTMHDRRLIRRDGKDYLSLFHTFTQAGGASRASRRADGEETHAGRQ
jgi:hypothetical protein